MQGVVYYGRITITLRKLFFDAYCIYPLNPDIIDCSISIVNAEASLHEVDEDAGIQDNQGDDGMSNPQECNNGQSSISPEKAAFCSVDLKKGMICLITSM